MLTSLLASLQEKLFSRSYLVGGLFPVTLFLVANALMLRGRSEAVTTWLETFQELEEKALAYGIATAGVLVMAYLLTAMNGVLLEMLEGKRAPVRWCAGVLYVGQRAKVRKLDEGYNDLVIQIDEFQRRKRAWDRYLARATRNGAATHTCGPYPRNVIEGLLARQPYRRPYWTVTLVLLRRDFNARVKVAQYRAAVAALGGMLATNSALLSTGHSKALLQAEGRLLEALRDLRDRLQFERIQLRNRRQFSYPGEVNPPDERSTNNLVAPTTLGNIGRTMRSYALTRYYFDLDIFWTRLQNALQRASSDYYSVLQDAKVQVDALASMTCLTAVFTLTWAGLSVFVYPSLRTFLIVGVVGPIVAVALYKMCCISYRVFADLMRSCVDLFRFDLLQGLHVPLPYGIDEERRLWIALGESTGYGTQRPIVYRPTTGPS